jgi:hypothetical protein
VSYLLRKLRNFYARMRGHRSYYHLAVAKDGPVVSMFMDGEITEVYAHGRRLSPAEVADWYRRKVVGT